MGRFLEVEAPQIRANISTPEGDIQTPNNIIKLCNILKHTWSTTIDSASPSMLACSYHPTLAPTTAVLKAPTMAVSGTVVASVRVAATPNASSPGAFATKDPITRQCDRSYEVAGLTNTNPLIWRTSFEKKCRRRRQSSHGHAVRRKLRHTCFLSSVNGKLQLMHV